MKEVMRDTSKLTPIEIALGVDENGMTTAGKLYEFLELNPAHYARWFKKNIMENSFAEKSMDYFPFTTNGECGGQASQDAKLTAGFAKKLSMMQKNQKGESARNYFIGVENGAKKMIGNQIRQIPLTEHPGEVANLIKVVTNRMDKQGSASYESMDVSRMICEQYGIQLPDNVVKVPAFKQMNFDDYMKSSGEDET